MVYLLKQIGFLAIMLLSFFAHSQTKAKTHIVEGNKYYQKGKYDNAENSYKKAIIEDPTSVKANYNLGNALFKQKSYKESITHFKKSAELSKSKKDKHLSYHNLGNAFMQEKDYKKAVNNYKSALKNDPSDNATRYNYALAKKMLEQEQKKDNKKNKNQQQNQQKDNNQQQNQQNQSNDKKSNQEKNKDKDGNKKFGEDDGGNKGKGNNPNQKIREGNKSERNNQGSERQNESDGILNALQDQESKTLRKIIQQKADKHGSTTAKDW